MYFIATSYDGVLLLLQWPLSVLATVVALACAFSRRARRVSTGAGWAAIAITLAAIALEWNSPARRTWDDTENQTFLILLFAPIVVSAAIIAFNLKRFEPPADETKQASPALPRADQR